MGLLRFILALSVFFVHTVSLYGLKLVGSSVAVQSFFVISGFYMSLILNEKYRGPGSYYLFISNRFLRILPAYWVVLALAALIIYSLRPFSSEDPWVSYSFEMFFGLLDIKAQASILFSNIFLLGQDILNLFRIDPRTGFFAMTLDPLKASSTGFPPVQTFFFVPPAWSLGTELLFYLLAPFVVRRKRRVIFALISASLLLRVVMFYGGYRNTSWQFQFFPTEIALFLAGALSYRLYRSGAAFFSSRYGLYATAVLVVATFAYYYVPGVEVQGAQMKKWGYYLLLIFLMPAAFSYTGSFKADRYLGDLSYPVYVVHYVVIWFWVLMRERLFGMADDAVLHLGLLVLTLLLSVALFHLVIKPMERFRQARVARPPSSRA